MQISRLAITLPNWKTTPVSLPFAVQRLLLSACRFFFPGVLPPVCSCCLIEECERRSEAVESRRKTPVESHASSLAAANRHVDVLRVYSRTVRRILF